MKKRGRPTAIQRDYGDAGAPMEAIFAADCGNTYKTQRAATNTYYMTMAMELIKEAASDIKHIELLIGFKNQEIRCKGVLEQLGRMLVQDGHSKADVIFIAKVAARAKYESSTVKEIERYIRHGRLTGEWE